eukprot:2599341-Prymnesium_polylepis.1
MSNAARKARLLPRPIECAPSAPRSPLQASSRKHMSSSWCSLSFFCTDAFTRKPSYHTAPVSSTALGFSIPIASSSSS